MKIRNSLELLSFAFLTTENICTNIKLKSYEDHLHHFVSSNPVVLVNAEGRLKKLYTPLRVICTEPHGALTLGLYVAKAYATDKDELVCITNGHSYLHKGFSIVIQFRCWSVNRISLKHIQRSFVILVSLYFVRM